MIATGIFHILQCSLFHSFSNINGHILGRKFHNKLPANTTGCCESVLLIGHHGTGYKFGDTLTHCLTDGRTFGTRTGCKGGILYITTAKDASTFAAKRCTHLEVTIGHIGVLANFVGTA